MAHHKTIDKTRWLVSQKRLLEYWQGETILEQELERAQRFYGPLMEAYAKKLSDTSSVLDVGCGPICAARFLEQGEKTYLDPLLDDFRRTYPGKLPKGKYLVIAAENIPEPDASFDIILCIDGLDYVINPEMALHEIARLLKPTGTLILGLPVFPSLLVRLRYMLECFLPILRNEANPYSYAYQGIRNTLARHFDIIEEQQIPETRKIDRRLLGKEYAFTCRPKQRT